MGTKSSQTPQILIKCDIGRFRRRFADSRSHADLCVLCYQNLEFFSSMDSSIFVPDYLNDLTLCSARQEILLPPTEKSRPQPSGFGRSVQLFDVSGYEYLNPMETHRAVSGSPYTLDDYSIHHLPCFDKFLSIPESIPPIEFDQFVSDCVLLPGYLVVPSCTDSTSTDNWQMYQPPLCSTATIESFNKGRQQQVPFETATLTATESFGSPMTLALEGGHAVGIDNSYQPKYFASPGCPMAAAKYNNAAEGRVTRAKDLSIAQRKMAQARSQAKYLRSTKGRMNRAITNSRYHAYSKAKMGGCSEKLAREKGELAAKKREQRYIIESRQNFSVTLMENSKMPEII